MNRNYVYPLALLGICIVSFQNCQVHQASIAGDASEVELENMAESRPIFAKSEDSALQNNKGQESHGYPSAEKRMSLWQPSNAQWEYEWDGLGSPSGSHRPNHLWFENPYDDDIDEPFFGRGACQFHFDSPARGFATVNRILTLDGKPCPVDSKGMGGRNFGAWFLRRDEYLDRRAGLTFEFDLKILKILPVVQTEAVKFFHIHQRGAYALVISTNCVKLGPFGRIASQNADRCVSSDGFKARYLDTTKMRKYRLVIPPNSLNIQLYVDGVSYLQSTGSSKTFVKMSKPGTFREFGETPWIFPYIYLGDSSSTTNPEVVARNEDQSPAFVLDGIRYTRGAFAPSDKMTLPNESAGPLRRRTPPLLPVNLPARQSAHSFEFDQWPNNNQVVVSERHFSGDAKQTFKLGHLDKGGKFVETATPPVGQGVLSIENAKTGSYVYWTPEGILGNGAWTIELRAKVRESHLSRSFAISIFERMGSVSLLLSKDKVELMMGSKPLSISHPVMMDTTDAFHTYRLVKKQNDPYVYLFIDQNPRPAIADFKMSAVHLGNNDQPDPDNLNAVKSNSITRQMRIWMGYTTHLMPVSWTAAPDKADLVPVFNRNQDLLVDYLRWSNRVLVGNEI